MSASLPCDSSCLSQQEKQWSKRLSKTRSELFMRSRVWMRLCLADRFNLCPKAVPLQAPPGEPPTLPPGFAEREPRSDALLLGVLTIHSVWISSAMTG